MPPGMLAFALRADGWYLRSDIIWARPNPMPESVTDRPTKSHCVRVPADASGPGISSTQEAVREPAMPSESMPQRTASNRGSVRTATRPRHGTPTWRRRLQAREAAGPAEAGRNVRSVWTIATQPYPEAHFATFPEALASRCILAGTSERGCCPECGAPWEREIEQRIDIRRTQGARRRQAPRTAQPNRTTATGHRPRPDFTHTEPEADSDGGWRPSCERDRLSRTRMDDLLPRSRSPVLSLTRS